MIDGIFIGFFVPPVIVILVAMYFVVTRLFRGDVPGAIAGFVKTIVYGAFGCLVLFILWVITYYAGGGH